MPSAAAPRAAGPQNPSKYPSVGPNYAQWGEQPGWIYYPWTDSYYVDPSAVEDMYREQGVLEDPPEEPGLTDLLIPVAGVAGAGILGKELATGGAGAIKDLIFGKGAGAAATQATPTASLGGLGPVSSSAGSSGSISITGAVPGAGESAGLAGGSGGGAGFGGGAAEAGASASALTGEAGRNVLGMGNPGALGGLGLVLGSVLAGKEILGGVVDPAMRSLMGAKAARPMSMEEVFASTGNAKDMLGTDSQDAIQYAIDNDLLRRAMTKKDEGEDLSGSDGAYGPRFGIYDAAAIYGDALLRKRRGEKGGSGFSVGSQTPYEGSLEKQLSYMDSAGHGWGDDVQRRATAARGLLGLGANGGKVFNQAPAPADPPATSGMGANPKFAGADVAGKVAGLLGLGGLSSAANLMPTAQLPPGGAVEDVLKQVGLLALAQPERSKTSSPGIGIDGKPLRYW